MILHYDASALLAVGLAFEKPNLKPTCGKVLLRRTAAARRAVYFVAGSVLFSRRGPGVWYCIEGAGLVLKVQTMRSCLQQPALRPCSPIPGNASVLVPVSEF